jgi:(+)-trans-carveol dehydrogenase
VGKLDGKVAFITGAARGQCRSHAVRLAQEGADIIAADLCQDIESVPYALASEKDLAETVEQVEALGRRIVARQADVRDEQALSQALSAGIDEFGRLDIVCANAGIVSLGDPLTLTREAWQDVIDINLTGVWQTLKLAAPHIVSGGRGGSMVVTGSSASIQVIPNMVHYSVAKHGVIALVKTFAIWLGPERIRVNGVLPAMVHSGMTENDFFNRLFRPDLENPTQEDFLQVAEQGSLLPHVPWVEAIDVSNAVLFLVSDEARYVTGELLRVDAGNLTK